MSKKLSVLVVAMLGLLISPNAASAPPDSIYNAVWHGSSGQYIRLFCGEI